MKQVLFCLFLIAVALSCGHGCNSGPVCTSNPPQPPPTNLVCDDDVPKVAEN